MHLQAFDYTIVNTLRFDQPTYEPLTALDVQQGVSWLLTLLEASKQTKLSRNTELFVDGPKALIVDLTTSTLDESKVVAMKIVDLVQPSVGATDIFALINDCLPTIQEWIQRLLPQQPIPTLSVPSTYLMKQLYTMNPKRLLQLVRKVTNHPNNHLESLLHLSPAATDATILGQLKVISEPEEVNKYMYKVQDMVRLVDVRKFKTYLDFGGGNGDYAQALKEEIAQYGFETLATCLDIENWYTKSHDRKHSTINYSFVNDIHLPFQDNYFDGISSLQVLHHLDDLWYSLTELVRVLKPNGVLFLREHDCQTLEDQLTIDLEHMLYEGTLRGNLDIVQSYQARYLSRRYLYYMLREVGLAFVVDTNPKNVTNCYYSVWRKESFEGNLEGQEEAKNKSCKSYM